jgi:glutathione reductase (NADPH)
VFTDAGHIDVVGQPYGADYFVIATGSKPMPLPIKGAEYTLDSKAFMALENLPRRIVFIGGGFISFEFAHFAARIGPEERQITILEVADRVLGPFDKDMVDLIIQASIDEGMDIQTGTQITAIEKKENVFLVRTGSGQTMEADLVVNGAGRVPELEVLQLENAGVKSTRRGIEVNSRMQTSVAHIFAVGDCAATIALARIADFEAHVAAKNILADKEKSPAATVNYASVPSVIFTYPQYGMVGQTEEALQKKGIAYRKSTDKGLQWPTYRRVGIEHAGYKILISEDGRILGAHVISDNPAGLINTFTQAMRSGITVDEIHWNNIMSPYPSRESDIIYMLSPLIR